jgi:mannose-6-phosphate isomerase-like protein (cupin superfamily)/predicted DNA-binding transcriptional regulator AlpA
MLNVPRHVAKPWGFEIWWAVTDSYAGKILHVEEGARLSVQYHEHKDESCYVLSGLVRLRIGKTLEKMSVREIGPGGCWRVPPLDIHSLEAVETSEVLEVSTPQLDDVVRLLDDYGRVDSAMPPTEAAGSVSRPARLLDREQLARKLTLSRAEVTELAGQPGFPHVAGYFRGRLLWDESAVEAWLHRPADVPDIVHAVRAG